MMKRGVPLILLAALLGSCQPGATLHSLIAQDFAVPQPRLDGPARISAPSSESGGATSHLFVPVGG